MSSCAGESCVGRREREAVDLPLAMLRRPLALACLLLVAAWWTGGADRRYDDVLIRGVPQVQQKPDFCGEACAEMLLRSLGKELDQDYVFDQSGLDPLLGRGCHTRELAKALKQIGFRTGKVWYKADAEAPQGDMERHWEALYADLQRGTASIVCMRTAPGAEGTEHFRLILGYQRSDDQVLYHEPAAAEGAYRRMDRGTLLELWPLQYDQRSWTVIRIRLEPGTIRQESAARGFTSADYAQHIMKLRPTVPREGFTIIIQPPFVVVGDEEPAMVRRRAERTVKWASDILGRDYFPRAPNRIMDIWLFKDKTSYRKHTWEVFHDRPDTPFGYCSDEDHALIMNIATGGGTLVHEIVHAFMDANFPACPAWFNEGLASLYEQCGERDGHIVGFTNWRLEGLQEAIRHGKVPAFKSLITTSTREFYTQDKGTNYSQARYLCYYLQQKGLLRKYYREFLRNHRQDGSGWDTLKRLLDREDMRAFKEEWEAYVLELSFP